MNRYVKKLASLSPASFCNAISDLASLPISAWRDLLAIRLAPLPSLHTFNAILILFPDLTMESAQSCRLQLLQNHRFFEELDTRMVEVRQKRVAFPPWSELLYMVVRFARPRVVFETGVFDGRSSAIILQALSDNGDGQLVSIDLPAVCAITASTHCMPETSLPPNCQPGWIIPARLRHRHRLLLGSSEDLLPTLFEEYPEIDIFFHDSLHTFPCQYFEYTTAWPHLSNDRGILLSDDVFWSPAFHKFCREKSKRYVTVDGFGAVRK